MALIHGKEGAFYAARKIALTINGGSTYNVTIPHHADFNFAADESFSLECWFRPDATSAGRIIDKLATNAGYALYIDGSGFLVFEIGDGTAHPEVTGDTDITDGTWHHCVGVRDVTNDKLYMYLDGAAEPNGTGVTDTTTGAIQNVGIDLLLGALLTAGAEGKLGETVIWGKALSAAEVAARYNSGLGRLQDTDGDIRGVTEGSSSDVIALYHVTENTGTVLYDQTANAHTGTIANAAQWTTAGIPVTGETPSGSVTSYTLANVNVDDVTLYDGVTALSPTAYTITPQGAITLDAAPSGALTADYTYYLVHEIGGFYNWTIDETCAMADTTSFNDAGVATFAAGVVTWTGSAEGFWVYPYIMHHFAQKVLVRLYYDLANAKRYEGWAFLSGVSANCSVQEVIQSPVQLQGTGALASETA